MIIKYLAALVLPAILVIIFTRVTYNHILGLILTMALIVGSVYKGYADAWPIIIIDAFSLTAGYIYSRKIVAATRNKA